jgi:hypothetical protein
MATHKQLNAIPDEPFTLFVFENEDWSVNDVNVIIKPWVTGLPQIGHTIQFSHKGTFHRAKIKDITWNLGDVDNNWMDGGSIHIIAILNY